MVMVLNIGYVSIPRKCIVYRNNVFTSIAMQYVQNGYNNIWINVPIIFPLEKGYLSSSNYISIEFIGNNLSTL